MGMRQLLVPVDLSPNSRAALRYAVALASGRDVTVSVIHAFQINAQNHFLNLDDIRQLERQAATEARTRTEAFVREAIADLHPLPRVETIVRLGFATEEIIAVSEQVQYDLVVMGTRGVTDLKTKFLGTNTAKVMENISSPVLGVTSEAEFRPIGEILYATDLERTNAFSLARLFDLARAYQATIRFLHFAGERRDHPTRYEQLMHGLLQQAVRYDKVELELAQTDNLLTEVYRLITQRKPTLVAVHSSERFIFNKVMSASNARENAERIRLPLLALN